MNPPYLCSRFNAMTTHAKNSFVWLWTVTLLSATVGMSVQQVYCYCTGKTTISIFVHGDACQAGRQAKTTSGCCLKKSTPAKRSCCKKADPKQHDCTKKTTQVLQLHTEYEVSSSAFKKLDGPLFRAFLPCFPTCFSSLPATHSFVCQGFGQPPPPHSGRMICVRYGVFRC